MGTFHRCNRDLAAKQYADGYSVEQISEMQGVGVEAVRMALNIMGVEYDYIVPPTGFATEWRKAVWTLAGTPEGAKETDYEAYFCAEWNRITKHLLTHPEKMYNVIERES